MSQPTPRDDFYGICGAAAALILALVVGVSGPPAPTPAGMTAAPAQPTVADVVAPVQGA